MAGSSDHALIVRQLTANDASATLVAEYHTKSWNVISKPKDGRIEISPPYEAMVDEIMVWVHLKKIIAPFCL